MAENTLRQKFYCFVDESGQDTKDKIFLVAIVVKEQGDLEILKEKLSQIFGGNYNFERNCRSNFLFGLS
ncbi:hypothetical protein HY085_01280 [Candidatus Gottesmanbacteria bacterium]|nr:hypothetical protein [Candidatus Gottesmanbacteria bacterium]